MTEETIYYYYQRDGKELVTVSLDVALKRRDAGTSIYVQHGDKSEKILFDLYINLD